MSKTKNPIYSEPSSSSSEPGTQSSFSSSASSTQALSLFELRRDGVPAKDSDAWKATVEAFAPGYLKENLRHVYLQILASRPRFEDDKIRGISISMDGTLAADLGWLMEPVVDKHGDLYAKCKASVLKSGGSIVVCSDQLKISSGDGRVEIANFQKHLRSKTHSSLVSFALPASHSSKTDSATSESASSSSGLASSTSASASSVRETRAMKDDMLRDFGISTEKWYEALVEASVVDTRPWSEWDSVGKRNLLRLLKLPRMSEKIARDTFEAMYKRIEMRVRDEVKEMLIVRANTFEHDGVEYDWFARAWVTADGWKADNHVWTFESVIAHGFAFKSTQIPVGGKFEKSAPCLEPARVVIGLSYWAPADATTGDTDARSFASSSHAALLVKVMRPCFPDISRSVLGSGMDSTNGNRATMAHPPFTGALVLDCYQHVLDLCAKDLMATKKAGPTAPAVPLCPAFYAAATAAHKFSVLFKATDTRQTLLSKYQLHVGIKTPLATKTTSLTRFAAVFMQMDRIYQLIPAIVVMRAAAEKYVTAAASAASTSAASSQVDPPDYGLVKLGSKNGVGEFLTLATDVLSHQLVYEGLLGFSGLLQTIIAAAGSETDYTASSIRWCTRELWEFCSRERAMLSKVAVRPIFEFFQNSMIERLLPLADVGLITSPLDASRHPRRPAPGEEFFQTKETAFKIAAERDDWTNAATLLDPASFDPKLSLRLTDAASFLARKILVPAMVRKTAPLEGDSAGAPTATSTASEAAKSKKDYDARVAAVRVELEARRASSDYGSDDTMWEIYVNMEIEKIAKPKMSASAASAAATAAMEDTPMSLEESIGAKLLEELRELVKYYMTMKVEKLREIYGSPLKPNLARKQFWPSKENTFPLLFFCACQMLPVPATSCSNERSHVPAARICSKARAAIKPDSVEKLTIAYFNLRDRLKKVSLAPGTCDDDIEDSAIDVAIESACGPDGDEADVLLLEDAPSAKRSRMSNSSSSAAVDDDDDD